MPAARGGLRRLASIRRLKSAIRCLANSMSPTGTAPVPFSSACNSTTRFSERWYRDAVASIGEPDPELPQPAFNLRGDRERRGRPFWRLAVQVFLDKVFPVSDTWHPLLLEALTAIPDVRAGDSVWWHCDMIHSVGPVQNQRGWGNVMYIPAAPWCPRNERYAAAVRRAFITGAGPSDFPAENYERDWPNRFQPGGLNQTGRRGLDLD